MFKSQNISLHNLKNQEGTTKEMGWTYSYYLKGQDHNKMLLEVENVKLQHLSLLLDTED